MKKRLAFMATRRELSGGSHGVLFAQGAQMPPVTAAGIPAKGK